MRMQNRPSAKKKLRFTETFAAVAGTVLLWVVSIGGIARRLSGEAYCSASAARPLPAILRSVGAKNPHRIDPRRAARRQPTCRTRHRGKNQDRATEGGGVARLDL